MEMFLKADTKQCKQSGTEEDFKEKEELMDSLRDKFAKKDSQKQASLSAKHKKEDHERGEKIQGDALLALKDKRTGQEDVPLGQKKKTKIDLEQILQERKEYKPSELKLREKELDMREKELDLQEKIEGQSTRGYSAAKHRPNDAHAGNSAAANGTDG